MGFSLGSIAPLAGAGIGFALGGPMGAGLGASLGGMLGGGGQQGTAYNYNLQMPNPYAAEYQRNLYGVFNGKNSALNNKSDVYKSIQSGYQDYLNPTVNPYLDSVYGQAASQANKYMQDYTLPSIDSRFGTGGRTGSGLYASSLGDALMNQNRALGEMANTMYGNAYETGQARRMQSLQGLQQLDLGRASAMANAYSPLFAIPQSSVSTNPIYRNQGAEGMGMASSGLGMGMMLKNLMPAAGAA